jgi:hypothetical protein
MPLTGHSQGAAMIQDITGVKTCRLHHDFSTVTGKEVLIFKLTDSPSVHETKGKQLCAEFRSSQAFSIVRTGIYGRIGAMAYAEQLLTGDR